ncbi:biotin--[acetyl-CoA-carboxylase] ligase [Kineosporia rhizophila]|uniref:biotin--[acetyl-CoA-carboxylase] ligase n=1 Tax=Kineosporia TaxID=49184 RepID=UPI001E5972FB|nr:MULTISPECIES: biotin--[acetyl-CoA-carboxylase] ligase [Kineosporia]MCE0536806.1 biotin--[acetyl-CoA-carboxylase] ligase [Kineosporia rhizophila]GLY13043.1 biotin--[acetyl-CoA-carboxylase] ligase [Kineosporia sp. NBRC 101677]
MPTGAWEDLERPPLRQAALRAALTSGPQAWRSVDVVTETGSTNADLLERARAGEPAGAVLVADSQNQGRGRLGRVWSVPPRSALTFSVLVRPTAPVETWSWLNLVSGIAVTDALIRVCGLPATLKWPNDVLLPAGVANGYAGDRLKVAGILSEVVGDAVVIGIGLNVSQSTDELPVPTATSLGLAGSATTDRDTVLRAVLRALAGRLAEFEQEGVAGLAATYRERCSTIGLDVRADLPGGISRTGLADGVDDNGRLLLRLADGSSQALSAGDVVHIRNPETA